MSASSTASAVAPSKPCTSGALGSPIAISWVGLALGWWKEPPCLAVKNAACANSPHKERVRVERIGRANAVPANRAARAKASPAVAATANRAAWAGPILGRTPSRTTGPPTDRARDRGLAWRPSATGAPAMAESAPLASRPVRTRRRGCLGAGGEKPPADPIRRRAPHQPDRHTLPNTRTFRRGCPSHKPRSKRQSSWLSVPALPCRATS